MIDLLPCPFCGGPAYWCGYEPNTEDKHECDQIVCPSCGFNLDVHGETVRNAETMGEARAIVATIWNTRAQPPATPEARHD